MHSRNANVAAQGLVDRALVPGGGSTNYVILRHLEPREIPSTSIIIYNHDMTHYLHTYAYLIPRLQEQIRFTRPLCPTNYVISQRLRPR